jgi:pyruvate ferredoxin oxidoreductase gamma subunit
VDAITVAQANQLGRIVNTTLVGAFAGLLKTPDIDGLIGVVKEKSPAKVNQNMQACLDGFRLVMEGREN